MSDSSAELVLCGQTLLANIHMMISRVTDNKTYMLNKLTDLMSGLN